MSKRHMVYASSPTDVMPFTSFQPPRTSRTPDGSLNNSMTFPNDNKNTNNGNSTAMTDEPLALLLRRKGAMHFRSRLLAEMRRYFVEEFNMKDSSAPSTTKNSSSVGGTTPSPAFVLESMEALIMRLDSDGNVLGTSRNGSVPPISNSKAGLSNLYRGGGEEPLTPTTEDRSSQASSSADSRPNSKPPLGASASGPVVDLRSIGVNTIQKPVDETHESLRKEKLDLLSRCQELEKEIERIRGKGGGKFNATGPFFSPGGSTNGGSNGPTPGSSTPSQLQLPQLPMTNRTPPPIQPGVINFTTAPPPEKEPTSSITAPIQPNPNVVPGRKMSQTTSSSASSGGGKRFVLKAHLSQISQSIREIRIKLNAIRTGVRSYQFPSVLQQFSSLVLPQVQSLIATNKKLVDRNFLLEQTILDVHCRIGTMPDESSPEGYLPDGPTLHAGSFSLLDEKRFDDWSSKIKEALHSKITHVHRFVAKLSGERNSSQEVELGKMKSLEKLAGRCAMLEALAVDWECLGVSIAADTVFETVAVQAARKMELSSAEKLTSDTNDELKAALGVRQWAEKPRMRLKVNAWRQKRMEGLKKVEQLLSSELQHFVHNGPQRIALRSKITLLHELYGLSTKMQLVPQILSESGTLGADNVGGGGISVLDSESSNSSIPANVVVATTTSGARNTAGGGSKASSELVVSGTQSRGSTMLQDNRSTPSKIPPASSLISSSMATTPPLQQSQQQRSSVSATMRLNSQNASLTVTSTKRDKTSS